MFGTVSSVKSGRFVRSGLWGLIHRTHNKCYASFKEFKAAVLGFLCDTVPRNWREFCDEVTDNFRIIGPANFRVLG